MRQLFALYFLPTIIINLGYVFAFLFQFVLAHALTVDEVGAFSALFSLVNIFMASAISVEPASTETLSVTDRVGTAGVAVSGGRVGTTGAQAGEVGPGQYSGHSSSATSSPSHSGRMLTTIRSGPSAPISFSPAFSRLGRITGSAIGMVPITTGTGGSRISTPVDILVPATITVAPTMSRSL